MPHQLDLLPIEIALLETATPQLMSLKVPLGTTVEEAVSMAGICALGYTVAMGGQAAKSDCLLKANDRIDLLPPLQVTPEEARQLRKAKKAREAKQ